MYPLDLACPGRPTATTLNKNPILNNWEKIHFRNLQNSPFVSKPSPKKTKINYLVQKVFCTRNFAGKLAKSLNKQTNEAANDKIRKYRADYNNNPPDAVAFMPAIAGTNGRLHSDFIRLLFLQAHRKTDRFFTGSGVQSA